MQVSFCPRTYFSIRYCSLSLETMIFVLLMAIALSTRLSDAEGDNGRYLVYPPGFGNKVQFIVGIGVPASNLPTIQSVTWGYVIKTNYVLPTNVTEYGDIRRKRSASISRWDFYRSITDVLNRSGLPGEECIKRSICEASETKFARDDTIGEFFHILLSPSSTKDTETEYYEAEIAGLSGKQSCSKLYERCPLSLLGLISVVESNPIFIPYLFPM